MQSAHFAVSAESIVDDIGFYWTGYIDDVVAFLFLIEKGDLS